MENENKYLHRGLGCPQQAKRAAAGGEAVIGISVKDIPIHCLPKTDFHHYRATMPSDHSRYVLFSIREILPYFHRKSYISLNPDQTPLPNGLSYREV